MNHLSSPRLHKFLAKPRLGTLWVAVAIIALILALVVQDRRSAERERRLLVELAEARSRARAGQAMMGLFGDLGIIILWDASRVELLRVSKTVLATPVAWPGDLGTSVNKEYDRSFAARLAGVLLDPKNYGFINADDDPEPQLGFRFWRGKESLDVLIGREGSRPGSLHQDIWVLVRNERGAVVHRGGPTCLGDVRLQDLIEETAGGGRHSSELRP